MSQDVILIEELSLRTCIGCSPEERSSAQKLLLDIEIKIDSRASALSRQLSDTVCYDKLAKDVQNFASSQNWVLVEEFAEALSRRLFTQNPKIEALKLSVRKFVIPDAKSVAIIIERERPDHLR